MNTDDFEEKLQRQELRPVPSTWREEILDAARKAALSSRTKAAAAPVPRTLVSTLSLRLSALLWPSPKAWAALAIVWAGLCAVQLSLRDKPALLAQSGAPVSAEVGAALEQQQLLLAELIGPSALREEIWPQPKRTRPRSERRKECVIA